jgi:hypothetical protein
MPVHDWARVDAGIYRDFRHGWIVEVKRVLNGGLLPDDHYAMIEPVGEGPHRWSRVAVRHSPREELVAVVEIVSPAHKANRSALWSFSGAAVSLLKSGTHLLVADLVLPGPYDPQGTHAVIWSEFDANEYQPAHGKPLTLASYAAGNELTADIEPVAVGDVLPDMPLFLTPQTYVRVPLESAYLAAFDAVPRYWQGVLASPS